MKVIYMVVERNLDEPDEYGTPSKLFINREDAERYASIEEDAAAIEHIMGRTNIQYSYVVEPWVLNNSL